MAKKLSEKFPEMNCFPSCTYFPCMECKSWTIDDKGLKRRTDGKQFICGYDGHLIKSWTDECPKDIDELELTKENK